MTSKSDVAARFSGWPRKIQGAFFIGWYLARSVSARREARRAATFFSGANALKGPLLKTFPDGFMPFVGAELKAVFEELKMSISPDLIFTHYRKDAHQDHRQVAELTWNTFRDHLILEYEIPKYDGDMGQPNIFVPLERKCARRKSAIYGRFSVAAIQALVSAGHVSLADASARDGMQRAKRIRRSILRPQAGPVDCEFLRTRFRVRRRITMNLFI